MTLLFLWPSCQLLPPLRLASAAQEGLIRTNPYHGASLPHRSTVDGLDDEDVRCLEWHQLAEFLAVVNPTHRTLFKILALDPLAHHPAQPIEQPDSSAAGRRGSPGNLVVVAVAVGCHACFMPDKYMCRVDDHGEDITQQVLAALEDEGGLVFRAQRLLHRRRRKELQVYCSEGHLNIVVIEDD